MSQIFDIWYCRCSNRVVKINGKPTFLYSFIYQIFFYIFFKIIYFFLYLSKKSIKKYIWTYFPSELDRKVPLLLKVKVKRRK